MGQLLKVFWDIMLFQAGPEDLPASAFLLRVTLAVYVLSGVLVGTIGLPLASAVLSAVVDTALLVGLAWLGLYLRGFESRLTQTLTALLGALGLLGLIAWPITLWYQGLEETQTGAPFLVMIALVLWNVAVLSHILRRALSITLPLAAGISLAYLVLSVNVNLLLFPPLT